MVWAAPGVGKTMFCLSIALAVAGGGELLGWKAQTPRRVLLVDGEMNTADLVDRCRMLATSLTGGDPAKAAENMTILARQHQDPDARFPDLAEEEGRQALFDRARRGRFDLVILDNFSTLATVDDENAAAAMTPVLAFLMRMKQAGIACILVHHSNKSGEGFRGSSKLATTFEAIVGLRHLSGVQGSRGTAFTLSWDKYRGLRDDSTRGQSAWLQPVPGGGVQWAHELSEDEECVALLNLVQSLRYATQKELAEALGCSTGKLSKLKGAAIHALGLISKENWEGCLEAARDARGGGSGPDFEDDNDDF